MSVFVMSVGHGFALRTMLVVAVVAPLAEGRWLADSARRRKCHRIVGSYADDVPSVQSFELRVQHDVLHSIHGQNHVSKVHSDMLLLEIPNGQEFSAAEDIGLHAQACRIRLIPLLAATKKKENKKGFRS